MSWLTDTALYTGLLIALVLVLRRPVARMFGPGLAYSLWALPLLRLAFPPIVLPAQPVTDTIVVTAVASSPMQSPAVEAPVWSSALAYAPLLEAIWLAGAIAFLVWRISSYLAMRRKLLRGAVAVGREGKVRLVESPATPAPAA
ncbi:MAG: M56 family metallopeptidase, partial [Novosphingobium sp.]